MNLINKDMYPVSDLIECSTIEQVKAVRRKYADRISYNYKWNFDNACEHAMIRIRRLENEKKKSYINQLN